MRTFLLIPILLAFAACARHDVQTNSVSNPATVNKVQSDTSRTASNTLIAYYAAIQSMDTELTYALCSSSRLVALKPQAEVYFANCYRMRDTMRVVREIPTSSTQAEVLFTDERYDRATGVRMDSALVECTMVREAGVWKVLECHQPWPADTIRTGT